MSILFTPSNMGPLRMKNRFIFSACEDAMATVDGAVTDDVLKKNKAIARGEVGLIISSHMFVHRLGKTRSRQLGIHDDAMIPGLKELARAVHQNGGRIVFQLGHAGAQTKSDVIGRAPLGPSAEEAMSEGEIREVIESFIRAAERAAEAGADGVQVHAAHGYLISQFLSPYYNRRRDAWGGSPENCFRFLGEIVDGIKKAMPSGMALAVKINADDYTPTEGVTPTLAAEYAKRLAGLGIDGLEVSCGTSQFSPWRMCRGDVPVRELLLRYPEGRRSQVEGRLKGMEGQYDLAEGYNLDAAVRLKASMGNIPILSVGGWRTVGAMEEALERGDAAFISMCRPLIREPSLVKKIKAGKTDRATCTSCNKCLAALANDMPVRCYMKGFPFPAGP